MEPVKEKEMTPVELEETHVHKVYNEIADHFSSTRYKPWPVVEEYLKSQPKHSFGGDIGCGNGKYLNVNDQLYVIGSDRSEKLIEIVHQRGFDGIIADGLSLGFRPEIFDFCISIAVIHHFSTPERRLEAINEIMRVLKPGGTALIYVWAMEQEKLSKRTFETQDEMVSWKSKEKTLYRYYHLFYKGELDQLCIDAGAKILNVGYDRDNHYVIIEK